MKRSWLAASLILVVVFMGWIGARHEAKAELQRALANFRANLPPDARFSYDTAYPRMLARGAGFTNARFTRGDTSIFADVLTVNNPSGIVATGLRFSKIHATNLRIRSSHAIDAHSLTISGLQLPPLAAATAVTKLPDPSLFHFRSGHINRLDMAEPEHHCTASIQNVAVDDYGRRQNGSYTLDGVMLHCPDAPFAPPSVARLPFEQEPRETLRQAPFSLHVAQMHMTGIDLGVSVARLEGTPLDKVDATHAAKEGAFTMNDALLEYRGIRLRIPDLHETHTFSNGVRHTHAVFHGPRLLHPDDQPLIPVLASGGVAQATIDADMDNAQHEARLTETLDLPQLGTARLRLELDHLPPDDEPTAPSLPSPTRLSAFEIRYTDIDLIRRGIAAYGKAHDAAPRNVIDTLKIMTMLAANTAPALSDLAGYLEKPDGRTFRLTFRPTSPIPVTGLAEKLLSAQILRTPDLLHPPVLAGGIE